MLNDPGESMQNSVDEPHKSILQPKTTLFPLQSGAHTETDLARPLSHELPVFSSFNAETFPQQTKVSDHRPARMMGEE